LCYTPREARRLPVSVLADSSGRVFCPFCRSVLALRESGRGYCERCERTFNPLDILIYRGATVEEAIRELEKRHTAQQGAAEGVFLQQ